MRLRTRLIPLVGLCSVLGSLTLAQATPSRLTTCTTITASGSYVVRQNLSKSGNCIVIQADYVTLNLAGYTLSGDGTGSGVTDEGVARSGITVRSGTITSFDTGINLAASTGTMLQNVRVLANVTNGILTGDSSLVTSCMVAGHSTTGLSAGAGSLVAGTTVYGGTTGLSATCATLTKGNSLTGSTDAYATSGSNCLAADGLEDDN